MTLRVVPRATCAWRSVKTPLVPSPTADYRFQHEQPQGMQTPGARRQT